MPTKVERLYQTQPRWMRRLVRCMLLLACVGPVAAACASLPSVEKDYAVGEAAEADGWRLTLHSLVLLPGDRWRQPDPGKVFGRNESRCFQSDKPIYAQLFRLRL